MFGPLSTEPVGEASAEGAVFWSGWSGFIGGLINFEDGVAGGHAHDPGKLAGLQSLHGAAQFCSQPFGGNHSKRAAFRCCRIRRLGLGHGREVCSRLQFGQDVFGLFLRLHHDDADGKSVHLRLHRNTPDQHQSKG
jgi:hypothetical protein